MPLHSIIAGSLYIPRRTADAYHRRVSQGEGAWHRNGWIREASAQATLTSELFHIGTIELFHIGTIVPMRTIRAKVSFNY